MENNREESRDRERRGGMRHLWSLPQEPTQHELAMYGCNGRIACIEEAGSGRGSIRLVLLEHGLGALLDLLG